MQALHESARAFKCNQWYSRLGAAVVAAWPDLNEDELVFDPEPIYDACLGHEWFLTMPEASSEVMSKLPPYLEKYTTCSIPAYPCKLLVDNARTKISVVCDFCFKVAEGQLPTTLFQ